MNERVYDRKKSRGVPTPGILRYLFLPADVETVPETVSRSQRATDPSPVRH